MPISDGMLTALRVCALAGLVLAAAFVAAGQSAEDDVAPEEYEQNEPQTEPQAVETPEAAARELGRPDEAFAAVLSYGAGVAPDVLVTALENAAEAGAPLALWRLGVMYESGIGVDADLERALGYFETVAERYQQAPPRSVDADVIANSLVKLALYHRVGVPGAGITVDLHVAERNLIHAATRFRSAEAQYQLALLYLETPELGYSTVQAVRWFRLAAQKGHHAAQARLGDLLFRGSGFDAEPVEGLMWLTLAVRGATGTADEAWIDQLADQALSLSTAEIRDRATHNADMLQPQIGG